MKRLIFLAATLILLPVITNAQAINRFDIVIDELMVDPSPAVSLPSNEWIELRNTSVGSINLAGWRIAQPGSQSGPMPNYNLAKDSFVIVCTGSAVAAMSAYGHVISVTSFPSLNNTGDIISLISPQNKVIHSIHYTNSWYQDELKKNGGWTLEMIDPKNPCTGLSNWKASTDPKGGTPGKKNSIDANNPDQSSPQLLRAFATDSVSITLVFNEPLDSVKGSLIANYLVSGGIGLPQKAVTVSPVFDNVSLKLTTPLQRNKIYTVTTTGVTDCAGNIIGTANSVRVGLSTSADSLDLVVNEILFNPPPAGTDYIELYNRSNKIIDLQQISIANRNSTNVISSIKQLSLNNYPLFPGEYMVVTDDPAIVKSQYITKDPGAFVTVSPMPSFNNDKGDAIILNGQGRIIDELQYNDSWHFKLLDNHQGVSLERIDPNASTQQPDNWHSAATSAGYGTPTYRNSQYKTTGEVAGTITVEPAIVSPDNDGIDDFATISYSFPGEGYVANITIFDASGRAVRYLQRNALCGTQGNYRWDGLGEKNQKLPIGIYIIYTEVFNLKGRRKHFKNTIVLARRNS